ncbi:MAG: GNAT family N-acetyltransferase, partial [Cyclobacteriaceae bacterium]|nr:GNAT family N-acetyltransferase [Cyclobacteriaceae bacterium]
MDIRFATSEDIDKIVNLLKLSHGQIGNVQEKKFWLWKHENNPFGKSPVLLAFQNDLLVGLRVFMRWRFRQGPRTLEAYRAVDTATHPAHQGKGIFRQLTTQLVNKLMQEDAFIFNTPNRFSMPGYLKMGWTILDRTPLCIGIYPFNIIQHKFATVHAETYPQSSWEEINQNWSEIHASYAELTSGWVVTDYNLPYMHWRYRDIPFVTYRSYIHHAKDNRVLVVYRVKAHPHFTELRITDLFFEKLNKAV